MPLACVLNCTLPIDWVKRLLGLDHGTFESMLDSIPPGSLGLRFIPYLDGERTPNLPSAAGELRGLRAGHGPAHLSRAVLEGVTSGLVNAVHAFERSGATAERITLVGGGARSGIWAQLLSDWLELPIERPAVAEAAARGAALQAAHVVAGAPVRRTPPNDERWEPRLAGDLADVAASYAALAVSTEPCT